MDALLGAIYKAIDATNDIGAYEDALSCIRDIGTVSGAVEVELAHDLQRKLKQGAKRGISADRVYELNRKILLYCAPECFDDYMLYMEIDRPYEKQFYLPRRKQLKPIADAMEKLERRELEFLGISMPPSTGKTTTAEFFLTWTGARHFELPILTGSHNNSFLRGMYGEILRMLDPDGEYKWHDVFPHLKVISTNAQDMQIDIGRDSKDAKRFTTYMFSSIGSGNAGKIRAGNLLYADDLVSDLEEALSRERLDKLFEMYSTDLLQRQQGSCAQLMIATRWSVHDVLGRMERLYEDDPKAQFIVCPALDENDESLFNYPIPAGLTTKFLHQLRDTMDSASFNALYMGKPVEREGQLYPESELRRYFELPDGEPDAILSVCDTKDKGTDYCFSPIVYQYGQDFYLEDLVCDNSTPEVVEARLVEKHLKHKVQLSLFESNSAGGRIAQKVQQEIKDRGGRTKITTKYTTQNKETKIIVNSSWVKEHVLFKDNSVIQDKEYRKALQFLCGYTMAGKNKNDDVPDGMAILALYAQGFVGGRVEAFKSPFRL